MGLELVSSKKAPLIGLDISTDFVKMVELTQKKGAISVERCAIQPLPEGALVNGTIAKADDVAQAIKACHSKLGSKSKSVAIALPISTVVIKRLSISPDLTEDQAEDEVTSQIGGMLPFDVAEANIDFQLMPASAEDDGQTQEQAVLAIAVKSEKLDEWTAVVEDAGLHAEVVDCESLAYHTALQELLDRRDESVADKNFALVCIGRNTTSFVVLRNGEVIYSRDALFGLASLASEVMLQYGVDESVAAQIVDGTRNRPDGYESALTSYAESAAQEIQRAFQLFITSTSHTQIDGVFLHDEGAVNDEIPGLVAEQLQTNCQLFNPFEGLEIGFDVKSPGPELFARLVVACGLAYRRFDK